MANTLKGTRKEESFCELCGESCTMEKETKKRNTKKEKVKIRFCPKCGNTEVKFIFKLKNLFGVLPRMECPKCGYHNAIFPIIEIEKGKIKEVEKLIFKKPKKETKK